MSIQLMPDERIIAEARQHWSVVAPPLAGAALALIVLSVILAVLPADVGSFSTGAPRLLGGLVIGGVVLIWAGIRFLRWRSVTYVLTDRRIVLESGILARNGESIPLDRVQNTRIRRPLGDRMIGAGDIEIESAGRDGAEVLHRVPNAKRFYTEVLDAMEAHRGAASLLSTRSV